MGRKLLTDGDSPPLNRNGAVQAWDVKDHSPLLDENKFAFSGENWCEHFAL